jgi:ABC-type glycerol-3-phosphate transport system substrate-binding protein
MMKIKKQKLGLLCASLTLAACQGCATTAQQPSPAPAANASSSPQTVSEGTFTGYSNDPVFNKAWDEALANAIEAAKKELKTLKVEWRLEELSGVRGGYIPQHTVNVKIHARAVYP